MRYKFMRNKRSLFFILILFLILFSTSFVSASENLTHDNTNEMMLSVDSNTIENEKLDNINLDSVSQSLVSTPDQVDDAQNTDEIENESCLTYSEKAPILGASNDEPILGADQSLNGGSVQQIMDKIVACSNSGGGTVYLNGGTYYGQASLNAGQGQMIDIKNVKVVGGSQSNPNQKATISASASSTALNFNGYGSPIPGQFSQYGPRMGYYSNSGVRLENVVFENLIFTQRGFSFNSGSLTNVVFNNIDTNEHLFFLSGSYFDKTPVPLTNVNFTNCHQTYEGKNPQAGTDGSGQLGAVFGAKFTGCNFINTSSATHGGAFCLSDESEWGAARVASSLTDCNFINITSRWFAVYIHGNFSTSFAYIDQPQVIDNCKFINCTSTGEYGGALGISHNGVIIRNSDFINNTGGQGSAIMVGGIDRNHDGFNGRNTKGNNIVIDTCTFEGNVAKIEGQSSSVSPEHGNFEGHPTGNAGAIYVYGNDTQILNSIFRENVADSGEGAAIYIHGERTVIDNSEFYDHESDRGTVYIEGGNTVVSDSTFKHNTAEDGAGVYVKGDNTKINSGSSFIENTAENGAGVYIEGKNTEINHSTFDSNNATNGGAVYINGDSSRLEENTFNKNTVDNHGGAVFIQGDSSWVSKNTFTDNEAVPQDNSSSGTTGLGGAFYVDGDNTMSGENQFTHNKARNGSAIYTT